MHGLETVPGSLNTVPRSPGTVSRSPGTVQNSLETVPRSLGTVQNSLWTVTRSLGTVQRKATPFDPRVTRKNFSVSMVNTRSAKKNKTKVSSEDGRMEPPIETDIETLDQSVDEVETETTETKPMRNAEEQKKKTMELLPIDTAGKTTSNTPETIMDESQTKITSFTERIARMGGMKPRDKEEGEPTAEKGKTVGTVSTITTEANQNDDQVKHGATADHETTTPLELDDLMAKLDQIDKN